ncbi:MAG TPA: RNA-binding protein [Micropepsaceae bacterium]|nr:RNA-binding protein [Micropepsaceae bacterium]
MTAIAEHDLAPDEGRAMGGSRERRCIVTGDRLSEARLYRFVADPEGKVVPDVEAKLPGRGLWVRAEKGIIAQACAKGLFSRAAKASLVADGSLPALAERRLVERMLELLGLARRSGELILGFEQVDEALRGTGKLKNPPCVIVEASDASSDGTRKLQGAARARSIFPFVIGAFTSDELSLALGRPNVVHAALKSGRLAERMIFDAGRLEGFRPLKSWIWAGFSGV